MPAGKLASQAGHAFLEAFFEAERTRPDIAARYAHLRPGTKVTLVAPSQSALERALSMAEAMGISCALIVDSGHVLPPHFDGSPIVTALGLGPATRKEVKRITKAFALAP